MAAPVITVDGSSSSGKGTVADLVAADLGWQRLDSGLLYRAVAWLSLERDIDPGDTAALLALVDAVSAVLEQPGAVDSLRSEQIGQRASEVAPQPLLRRRLLGYQRRCRRSPGLVVDGRDAGTVVFPDAPLKIFLRASLPERARRRHAQLKARGETVTIDAVLADLRRRDRRDRSRAVSPLCAAPDAVTIDSSSLSAVQVAAHVLQYWQGCCVSYTGAAGDTKQ